MRAVIGQLSTCCDRESTVFSISLTSDRRELYPLFVQAVARSFLLRARYVGVQADRLGDLDHETRRLLDRTAAKESSRAMSARLVSFDQKRTELTPGTVLVRDWDRQSQAVGAAIEY